jgi:hypothetical protein
MQLAEIYDESKERTPSQRQLILNELRKAGDKGVLNIDMTSISHRWGARIQELYVQGYEIELYNHGEGVVRYTLISEPESLGTLKTRKAKDILLDVIGEGEVDGEELSFLLDELGLNVTRKAGTYTKR